MGSKNNFYSCWLRLSNDFLLHINTKTYHLSLNDGFIKIFLPDIILMEILLFLLLARIRTAIRKT